MADQELLEPLSQAPIPIRSHSWRRNLLVTDDLVSSELQWHSVLIGASGCWLKMKNAFGEMRETPPCSPMRQDLRGAATA